MTQRRVWLAVTALAIVLGGATFGWFATRRAPAATAADSTAAASTPNVSLVVARAGEFTLRIDAQGRIGPPAGSSAKIAFAQGGILETIDVHVGDGVRAGQQLARLDRAALASGVSQAQADARSAAAGFGDGAVPSAGVESARAKLGLAISKLDTLQRAGPSALSTRIAAQSVARQAALKVAADRATLARDKTLFAAGVLAQKDVDAAQSALDSDLADERAADAKVSAAGTDFDAAVKAAQADVASARNDVATARAQRGVLGGQAAAAEARLEAARIAYRNGVLDAPSDGVVLAILKHAGEFVDPTQPVMEIGPALGHNVTLTVPADVARRIAVGNPATLHLPQTRERSTQGRVIAVVPAVDSTTQLATVVVSGTPSDAVPGDAVTVTIVVGHAPGVIVPSSAIVQDPQTGKTVVFVREEHAKPGESAFALREVEVRASDTATASIASGLKPGERIAAQGGYALLAPGGG